MCVRARSCGKHCRTGLGNAKILARGGRRAFLPKTKRMAQGPCPIEDSEPRGLPKSPCEAAHRLGILPWIRPQACGTKQVRGVVNGAEVPAASRDDQVVPAELVPPHPRAARGMGAVIVILVNGKHGVRSVHHRPFLQSFPHCPIVPGGPPDNQWRKLQTEETPRKSKVIDPPAVHLPIRCQGKLPHVPRPIYVRKINRICNIGVPTPAYHEKR